MATDRERPAVGAYGLRLHGVDAAGPLLVDADASWPLVEIGVEVGIGERGGEFVAEDEALVHLRDGGAIRLDRRARRADFTVPRPLTAHELVHPYLAPVAAVTAYWFGRESFHAGAVALDGDVWGVVGDRFAGKSSMLAWLARSGHDIVCDDMLVLDQGTATVYAGPRSIDLRREAAERLDAGEALGVVGARERWRLVLPPLDASLVLHGWVFLAWGDLTETRRLSGPERLALLASQRGLRVAARDPAALVDLISLPCWELRRPRDWSLIGDAGATLLDRIGA
jgi:hypothetical protein